MFQVRYATGLSLANSIMGEGEQDTFSTINVADVDKFLKAGLAPGDFFQYNENIYGVARLRTSAGAVGDTVKLYHNAAARLATVTSATNAVLTCSGAAFVADELVGMYVFVKTGTGIGQRRRILANTTTTITVARYFSPLQLAATSAPDAFDTTPVNTDTISIFGYGEVEKTTAVTDSVQGVLLGTVTQDNYCVFVAQGPALVNCVGSTDALTAGGPVVPSATAGVAKGFTTAGETAAEARLAFGIALDLYAGAKALRHVHLTGNRVLGGCSPIVR